jgi:hypothetical protein
VLPVIAETTELLLNFSTVETDNLYSTICIAQITTVSQVGDLVYPCWLSVGGYKLKWTPPDLAGNLLLVLSISSFLYGLAKDGRCQPSIVCTCSMVLTVGS